MKILITGSNGQLGNEIQSIIKTGQAEIGTVSEKIKNAQVKAIDLPELDITCFTSVEKIINEFRPDVVINCAAFTNVDGCEDNVEAALSVNGVGPENLAVACEAIGAKLVQVSTDYVFNAVGASPISEDENPNPNSVYGKTKLIGEGAVQDFCTRAFIVRTSWLYGYVGNNFVYTMRRLGNEKESLNVVNDQVGNPTHANDVAYHILKLIETENYGIYHCTGKGECSWYDFAKKIMELSKLNCTVNPCTSEEYKTAAKRPVYSSLDNKSFRETIGDEMRNWEEAIESFINKIDNK